MKKQVKKIAVFMLSLAILLSSVLATPSGFTEVQAATTPSFYSDTYVTTYKTGDTYKQYWAAIAIAGSPKKSKIKSLKSSNKNVKVEKRDGYIVAYFGDKTCKTTISCKVNGTTIKTVLNIKKYTNPAKSIKIGSTNFTSKFKNTDTYKQSKTYKKQTLSVKMNSNWKIRSVYVHSGNTTKSYTGINKSSFSKKITMSKNYDYVDIYCYNTKTGVNEVLTIYKTS